MDRFKEVVDNATKLISRFGWRSYACIMNIYLDKLPSYAITMAQANWEYQGNDDLVNRYIRGCNNPELLADGLWEDVLEEVINDNSDKNTIDTPATSDLWGSLDPKRPAKYYG
jgi:hypothetical protein